MNSAGRRRDRPSDDARVKRGERIQKKVMQSVRWKWIRAVRHDETLTLAQRTVAAEILDSYNDYYGYGWASSQYIADNLHLARSTVTLAERVLEAKGYIITLDKGGGRGRSSQRKPDWSKGIAPPKSRLGTGRPAVQKKDLNCPTDNENCPTDRNKTVRLNGHDSTYDPSYKTGRGREGCGRGDGMPSRNASDAGSEEAARQTFTAIGERRFGDSNAPSLGDAIKPAVDDIKHAAAAKAVSKIVKQNWKGALEKIDPDAMVAIFEQAVAAEETQPGSGRAILMRAVNEVDA